jgi:2-polyprenyl-3-methyl-5-hydroxy-6-metoxy-1,4-benzoquinol methylase
VGRTEHWDTVYSSKRPDEVSWFQENPSYSLGMIQAAGLTSEQRVLDVGGGASVLVDRLLELGFSRPGVLDLSSAALATSQQRLGASSDEVEWIVGDVLSIRHTHQWDLWHDRAVFHFLVDPDDRARYRDAIYSAVAPGGHVVIATFGPDGPERCSGLDTIRCSATDLAAELGDGVRLVEHSIEEHATPQGKNQQFVYARFLRL